MIYIDRKSKTPIYMQIYRCIKNDILSGSYTPHSRLPATRQLSQDLGVSRNTVDLAYQQLVLEGYIVSHPGSGYTVEPIPPLAKRIPEKSETLTVKSQQIDEQINYDFWYPLLDCNLFPFKTWKKIYNTMLYKLSTKKYTAYPPRQGEPRLQKAIADYLFRSRGVRCSPERVIISCGIQFNLELLLKLFDPTHCTVAMEEPGYDGVRNLLIANHFPLVPIPVDRDGIQIEKLADCNAGLLYITPSHQFPTGAILSVNKRIKVLDWVEQNDAYIIEDDYDSELRYFSNPIPSLQSFDNNGRVIYLGTFSKVLLPGLRVSYLVLPERLFERYQQICGFFLCQVPVINQLVLAEFINSGHLERHIRRLCHIYGKRQAKFLEAVRLVFGEKMHVLTKDAGLHILADVETPLSSTEMEQRAKKYGIRVYSAKMYWMDPAAAPQHQLILGYGSMHPSEFEPALRLLYKAWCMDRC
jgi:GntR family transcriptional regulator / MocR family aminotransferase